MPLYFNLSDYIIWAINKLAKCKYISKGIKGYMNASDRYFI